MNNDELKKITEANRASWNEVTPIHQEHRKIDLADQFKKPGFSTLDKTITAKLKELHIDGKEVAQLCCNNGRETLSMISLGARSGIGFDISDEAINEANKLVEVSGINCSFVRTDVFDIDKSYYNRFDLILITIGALYWLPDLARFFKIANSMLRENGKLVIYESHPFQDMLAQVDEPEYVADDPYKLAFTYFRDDPWVSTDGIDYIGKSKYEGKINYGWAYKISDVLNAIIKGGLSLSEILEFPNDISAEFDHLEGNDLIPLSWIIVANK